MERIKALIFLEVALSIETMSELQSNFKRERISSILKKIFSKTTEQNHPYLQK